MQLNRIEMKNFRQYNGEHAIDFSTGEKNITLVLGENNAGKTGIYRALLFGLYGDRVLAQDSSSRKIHLVNFQALESNRLVIASVSVVISDDKGEYTVSRTIKATQKNGRYMEDETYTLTLDFKDLNGEFHKDYIEGDEEIQSFINRVLDENIKEFFLFDGEKIETLARVGQDSRDEVKNGIIKLMEIDKLEATREIIKKLENNERRRLTEKSNNSQLEEVEADITDYRGKLESGLEQKLAYEKNLESTEIEIKTLEIELSKSEEVRDLFDKKEKYLLELKGLKDNLSINKKMLEEYHFNQGAPLILNDYFVKVNRDLKGELLKQDDVISIHVIEETLNKGICRCCNQEVKTNEESLAFLNKIKNNYRPSKVTGLMEMISRESSKNMREKDGKVTKIGNILKEIQKLEVRIEKLNSEITKIEEKVSNANENEQNLKYKEDRYDQLKTSKEKDQRKIVSIEEDIDNYRQALNKLELEYNKRLKEDQSLQYEIKRLEMLTGLSGKLDAIYNKYVNITRGKLGEEATRTFKELIDDDGMSLVDKIIISDKYEMDIVDSGGRNVTQDISQGQQMVVALSFITSLARIASKSQGTVEYPLFMDTPFSRLSKENRRNLIENLPKLTRQWIPLLTDTEYSTFEKGIFDQNKKVGKTYKIVKINKHESEIIEI